MSAAPTEADGGVCTLDLAARGESREGEYAKRIIGYEFGKPISLYRAYEILHEVVLSNPRPRPKHRKNDPEAIRLWRESAHLLFTGGRTSTRRNASRSGLRRKPASANREH